MAPLTSTPPHRLIALSILFWALLNWRWLLESLGVLGARHSRDFLAAVVPLRLELERLLDDAAAVAPSGRAERNARDATEHFLAALQDVNSGGASPGDKVDGTPSSKKQRRRKRRQRSRAADDIVEAAAFSPSNKSTPTPRERRRYARFVDISATRWAPQVAAGAAATAPLAVDGGVGDGGNGGGSGTGGAASATPSSRDDATAALAASKCARGEQAACTEYVVNQDFDLHTQLEAEDYAVTPARRVELQMARYQTRPIFGIVENKLLAHSLLHSLGVPQLPVAYGGFARHQLSEWRTFDPEALRVALAAVHADARGAVIKPATDGGSIGLLLLSGFGKLANGSLQFRVDRHDGKQWRRLRWSTEGVVGHVTAMLRPGQAAPSSRWRQRFEHRGVLLQQRYRCAPKRECGGHTLLELKAHVIFGRVSCLVAERVPVKFDDSMYVTLDDQFKPSCWRNESGRDASTANDGFDCATLLPLVTPHLPQLADIASKVAAALLADWFRLDIFLGHPELQVRVNEVTYPSHILDTNALDVWLRRYRELQVRAFSGVAVYKRVSDAIGLDNRTFYDADGAALRSFISAGKRGAPSIHIMAYTADEARATARELRRNSVREARDGDG